ncbi:MAG: nucleoside hydrolase [Candidatus Aenigmarchaeota archaeon]|nr:nucleoside hydrolase [Candidatus Aenigmarchaeota archaeon]
MKNIIIDTDPGHDDALAIMLAVKSGMFNIRAVTTVAGNSTIENTTRNARYILKLLGREDIPVYSGAEKPLKRELVQAAVHGKSGFEGLDPQNDANLTGNAAEKIISIAGEGNVTLITLGPLTNIATAIKQNPEAMSKLKEIVMMGGAIRVPGNKSRTAEFNIFVDPEAADIVFRFPAKKTLVPLDACNHVKLQLEDFERIGGKLREPAIAMMKPYIRNIKNNEGVSAALMYDPLTIYSIMNPSACMKGLYNVMVETKGELTSGMSVADMRKKCGKPNMTVIERIDSEAFKNDFIRILSG